MSSPPASELPDWSGIPDPLMRPSAGERELESASVPSVHSPTARQVQRHRALAAAVVAVWFLGRLALEPLRFDLPQLPAWYLGVHVALPVSVGVALVVWALRPGAWGLGPPRRALVASTLAAIALVPAVAGAVPAMGAIFGPHFGFNDHCMWSAAGWTLVPLGAAAFALRRAFPASAAWRTAAIGAGVGLLAAAEVNLQCPNSNPLHVTLAHGPPVAIAAALTSLLLSRWARA